MEKISEIRKNTLWGKVNGFKPGKNTVEKIKNLKRKKTLWKNSVKSGKHTVEDSQWFQTRNKHCGKSKESEKKRKTLWEKIKNLKRKKSGKTHSGG